MVFYLRFLFLDHYVMFSFQICPFCKNACKLSEYLHIIWVQELSESTNYLVMIQWRQFKCSTEHLKNREQQEAFCPAWRYADFCYCRSPCRTSGWRGTCRLVPNALCATRPVAVCWGCRTGAASGARPWWAPQNPICCPLCAIFLWILCCLCRYFTWWFMFFFFFYISTVLFKQMCTGKCAS